MKASESSTCRLADLSTRQAIKETILLWASATTGSDNDTAEDEVGVLFGEIYWRSVRHPYTSHPISLTSYKLSESNAQNAGASVLTIFHSNGNQVERHLLSYSITT
jgi:hypothetical protein